MSRPIADYVTKNKESLINFQGEDVSVGIWINESPWKSHAHLVTNERFSTQGNCQDMKNRFYSVGHRITPEFMRECQAKMDEDDGVEENLAKYLAPHIAPSPLSSSHVMIDPTTLIIGYRFDIIMKTLFAIYKSEEPNRKVPKFVEQAYLRHIEVWNKFQELCKFAGDEDWVDAKKPCIKKTKPEDFIQNFESLLSDIMNEGFDNSKSLVPISKANFPLNGAHRVATALALKLKEMPVQITESEEIRPWEAPFFLSKGLDDKFADFAMLKFLSHLNNVSTIIFWPEAAENHQKMEGARDIVQSQCTSSRVLYKKTIQLNRVGLKSLVSHAYGQQGWLDGKVNQLSATFTAGGPATEKKPVTIWFIFGREGQMTSCKEALRGHFNLPQIKSSVHIPDFHEEAVLMAEMTLNTNSVYFMNHHVGSSCFDISAELASRVNLKEVNPKSFVHRQDIMVDSGAVMSFFGLRPRTDVDILFLSEIDKKYLGKSNNILVEEHAFQSNVIDGKRAWGHEHLTTGGPVVSEADLFTDPENYGYCFGLKFVSLQQLIRYKRKRAEKNKDDQDVAKIDNFLRAHL